MFCPKFRLLSFNYDSEVSDCYKNNDDDDGVVYRVAEIARSCDPGSEKVENFGRK